jgi:hypothetical protein
MSAPAEARVIAGPMSEGACSGSTQSTKIPVAPMRPGYESIVRVCIWPSHPGRHLFSSTAWPGLLALGDLLAAPSHPALPSSGIRAAFVPNTVAGAAPAFHRLPSTTQRSPCLYKDALRVNLTRPKHGPRKRAPRVVARCSRRACPEGPRGEGTLRLLRHGVSMELVRGSGTLANGRRTGCARKQHLEASWALTLGCLRLHLVGVRMFISPVQTSTDRKVPARGLQAAPAKQTRLWRS